MEDEPPPQLNIWVKLPMSRLTHVAHEVACAPSVLEQGHTQGSAPRVHQQALGTGPFGNTCEADAVSPEETMRGL
jgi:hypothetical protein